MKWVTEKDKEGVYITVKSRYKCFINGYMYLTFSEYQNYPGRSVTFIVDCPEYHHHRFIFPRKSLFISIKAKELK